MPNDRGSQKPRFLGGEDEFLDHRGYPRLFHATADQRRDWRVAGGGYGIHWPEIDEDISTEGLLRGGARSGWRQEQLIRLFLNE
jgi:hypothetical protein